MSFINLNNPVAPLPFSLFCAATRCGQPQQVLGYPARTLNAAQTALAVNAANGNVIVYDKSFTIADDGVSVTAGMLWNSTEGRWRLVAGAATLAVNQALSDCIAITEDDGRMVNYKKNDDGRYVCMTPDDRGLSFLTMKDGCFTRFFPDTGATENYDASQRLCAKRSAQGPQLEYFYADDGQLSQIKLPSGRVLRFDGGLTLQGIDGKDEVLCRYLQDGTGNLTTSIPLPHNKIHNTTYTHDKADQTLSIVSDDETKHMLSMTVSGAISGLQEGERYWKAVLDRETRTFTMTAGNGGVVAVEFDDAQHWKSLQNNGDNHKTLFECDTAGRIVKKSDQEGGEVQIVYDAETGLMASKTNLISGQCVINSYEKDVTSKCFGALLSKTLQEGQLNAKTEFNYNERRQCECETSPEGRKTSRIFNEKKPHQVAEVRNSHVIKMLGYDACGRLDSESSVDASGKVLEKITKKRDAIGRIVETETSEKSLSLREYDGLDRIVVIQENGRTKRFEYEGNKTITKAANGLQTESITDTGGLLVSVCEISGEARRLKEIILLLDGSIDKIIYADGREKQFIYDKPGHLSQCIMDGEAVVEFLYDESGRHIGEKRYDRQSPEKSLSLYKLVDNDGQLRFEVTVKLVKNEGGVDVMQGFVTEHEYKLGQRSATIRRCTAIKPDQVANLLTVGMPDHAEDRITRYEYDRDGNVLTEWVLTDKEPEPIGYTKKFEYDGGNRCTREVIYLDKSVFGGDLSGAATLVTHHWYDAAGRKIATLDADCYLTAFEYDQDGRLIVEAQYAAKQECVDLKAASIDIPALTNKDHQVNHDYDVCNRRFRTFDSITGLEVTREYDLADNVIAETRKDTHTGEIRITRKEYNAYNELIASATERACAQMTAVNDRACWATREYNPITGLCLCSKDERGYPTYYFYGKNKKPVLTIGPDGAVVAIKYDLLSDKPAEIIAYATLLTAEQLSTLKAASARSGFFDTSLDQSFIPRVNFKDRQAKSVYDAEGILIEVTKTTNAHESYGHNSFGEVNVTREEVEAGRFLLTKKEHDLRGNISKTIVDPSDKQIETTAKHDDALNRVTEKKEASGQIYQLDYQGLRQQTITDNDDSSRKKTITQDAMMRPDSESDWQGTNIKKHQYDHETRLHTEVNPENESRNVSELKNSFGEVTASIVAGRGTVLKRDVDGQVKEIANPDGSSESTGFDIRGLKENTTSLLGMVSKIENDAAGHLHKRTDDVDGKALVNTYVADAFGEMKNSTDATGLVVEHLSVKGGSIKTEITDLIGLRLTKQRVTNFTGQLMELLQDDTFFPVLYREVLERDLLGNELARKIDLGEGKFAILHETKFDPSGHAIEIKNGKGESTYHVYDKRGNLRYTIDAMGFVSENRYDANNRCIEEVKYATAIENVEIDQLDKQLVSSEGDFRHRFIRDTDGLVSYELQGTAAIEYRYNGAKEVIDKIVYAEPIDLTQLKLTDVPSQLATDRFAKNVLNRAHHYERDVMGRMTLERDPEGCETIFRYDMAGNEVMRAHKDTRACYRVYDKFGNLRFKIDSEGYIKERRYNEVHVCQEKISYSRNLHDVMPTNEVDDLLALLGREGVNRNSAAILTSIEALASNMKNEKTDVRLVKKLDAAHRVKAVTDGEGKKEKYKLDALSQVYEKTDKRGNVWKSYYNKCKQLESALSPTIDVSVVSYDEATNSLKNESVTASVESKFGYDAAFNQNNVTLAANITGEKRSVTSRHDKNHLVSGTKIENAMVANEEGELLKDIETNAIRDFAGREIVSTLANGGREFTVYDNEGRKRFSVDTEGYVIEYQYLTAFGEPDKVIHFAQPMKQNILTDKLKGLSLRDMSTFASQNQHRDNRTLTYTYNKNGQKRSVQKDTAYVAKVSIDESGKRSIEVVKFDRLVTFDYNESGQVVAERRSRPGGQPDSVTQHFYDKNDNEIATVTPEGYVTLRTYGMASCRKDGGRYLELSSRQYFNAVPAEKRGSLSAILEALVPHDKNDRRTSYEYDRRHLCIAKIVADGHPFFDSYLDADRKLKTREQNAEVTTMIGYDANGLPVMMTDACGEKSYLIRNAVGDIIWEIGYPVETSAGVKQTPVRQHFYNAHHQQVGSRIYASPGDVKFDDKGQVKLEGLVTESNMDQQTLILMCNRGLPRLTQDNYAGTVRATFNEMKSPMHQHHTATVYNLKDGRPVQQRVDRRDYWQYNLRGDVMVEGAKDELDELETHYQVNAFRERTDEGPAKGVYYIKHRFDNVGNKWFTNGDRAIGTISFFDENDEESITYRSPKLPLTDYCDLPDGLDRAKAALADADYEKAFIEFQRTVTYRNKDGQGIGQDTPWYRHRPAFEPANYDVTFTVVKESPTSNNYMLRFNPPDEVFLNMEFKYRAKGGNEWTTLLVERDASAPADQRCCLVRLGNLPTDAYEFRLDLYHKQIKMVDGEQVEVQDRLPSYRADGEVMLDTGHYEQSKQPIWYMENNTLVIAGNNKDISGVELVKDGKPVSRLAGTRSADGKLKIDVSLAKGGEYGFKYVYGVAALAGQLRLGQQGEHSVALYHPAFRFNSEASVSVVPGTLPPELISHFQYTTCPATKAVPDGSLRPHQQFYELKDVRIYWGKPIPRAVIGLGDSQGLQRYTNQIIANAPWRFGCMNDPAQNIPYAQLPVNPTSPLLCVKTNPTTEAHALQVKVGGQHYGSYQLADMSGGQHIALDSRLLTALPANAELDIVSLSSQPTSELISNISIGGVVNECFQSEEIHVNDLMINRYSVGGYQRDYEVCVDNYFAYDWKCSLGIHYPLHVVHDGHSANVVNIRSMPRLSHDDNLYFQQVTGPIKQGFPAGRISVSLIKDGDTIPLAEPISPAVSSVNHGRHDIEKWEKRSEDRWASMRVQNLQQSNYDAMHALYFKKLPAGSDEAIFEYSYTSSQGKKMWRRATSTMTTLGGMSVFTNNIPAGKYECRILPKKAGVKIAVADPKFRQDRDGYCYLDINITKQQEQYGQVFSNRRHADKLEIVKPSRLFEPDRWNNLRVVIDRVGNKIKTTFNMFNQAVKTKTPPVASTNAKGEEEEKRPLRTQKRVNKRKHLVEKIDAESNSAKLLPNQLGQNLIEEDADGIQDQHEYDLQARCVASKSAAFGVIRSSFTRENGLLVETRTYPNTSTEVITYNEDGFAIRHADRLARKDHPEDAAYFHPDRQNRRRVTINPMSLKEGSVSHTASTKTYHQRSGEIIEYVDELGRTQTWSTQQKDAADAYVGNITLHTDLAGQVIEYTLDFNKQRLRELGDISKVKESRRGLAENGKAPLPRDIRFLFDEAGYETDIIDDGAQLTTRKNHDAEGYSTEYYFIGHDGRVYQATNTTYDELHRIHQIVDTHIMIEFGYDKNSNRRYAKAFVLDKNGEKKPFARQSWYDYSPAGRVRFRDCIMQNCQMIIGPAQGMEVKHDPHTGLVESQTSMTTEGKTKTVKPIYGAGNAITGVQTAIQGESLKTENRELDDGDRLHIRRYTEKDKENPARDKEIKETLTLDRDGSVLKQVTEIKSYDKKDDWHKTVITRRLISKTGWKMVENVKTRVIGIAKNVDLIIKDQVTTDYMASDTATPKTVTTERLVARFSDKNGDHGGLKIEEESAKVKKATLVAYANANGAVVGIGPDAPTDKNTFPDGFRRFVVNSENAYLLKETANGRNYYCYAQKRPGKTTLMAYFGDLSDDLRALRDNYTPKELNIDVNHQRLSPNFPPTYPGKCTADGVKTYREIAEEFNYTGYAEAIAWANNADVESIPKAGTDIILPTLFHEVPETAQNGSMPAIDALLGSMSPALAGPHISVRPTKVNWALLAAEMAVGAAVVALTAGALTAPVAGLISSQILATAATYGIAGVAASLATQGVAIAAGEQSGINAKAVAFQAVAMAVSAGVLKGIGGANPPPAVEAQSFTLGDVAANVATAEAVAAAQQAVLMATGLQHKPDWQAFATAAFNGMAGKAVQAKFGSGNIATGIYTGVSMAGDTLIRGGRVDATTLSANMVGSLLGSTAGEQALKSMEKQPKHQPSPKPAGKGSRHDVHQPAPTHAPRKASVRASRSDGHLLADEYDRQRSFGVARNRESIWNRSMNQEVSSSALTPLTSTASDRLIAKAQANNQGAQQSAEMTILEEVAVAAAIGLVLPAGVAAGLGSLALATIAGPVAEIMLADTLVTAGMGVAVRGAVGGGLARFGGGLFGGAPRMVQQSGYVLPNSFKLIGEYDAYFAGSLPNRDAATFLGQKYSTYVLQRDTTMYRAGNETRSLGEFFTLERPSSEIQVRIDSAVMPQWPEGGTSVIDTGYEVLVPNGTIIHVGEVAPQGDIFLGGTLQVLLEKPWLNSEIKVINKFPLQEELVWNAQARK